MSVRIVHDGDGGDCIAALPILRQFGGGQLVFTQGKNPRNFKPWFHLLKRLFEAQDYVDSVVWEDHPGLADHYIQEWRKPHYHPNRTLAESQAAHLGLAQVNLEPWLRAHPSSHSTGKIIVARSARYQNGQFPWRQVITHAGHRMIFVGLPVEKKAFDMVVARAKPQLRVEFYAIHDFLDLAELIAGSDMLIANQSSPGWVAMGLGHPIIQETNLTIRDSRVPRSNAIYCDTNKLQFP